MPERYAGFQGVSSLTCTPVAAAGRWLGVIFADRGGGAFKLTDDERNSMWTLGRTAALAASVRIATSQQGRARLLQARIDLARDIHERVVQRLFGVSLVLGSDLPLSATRRAGAAPTRCRRRSATCARRSRGRWRRPRATPARRCARSSRGSDRHYKDLPLELEWEPGVVGARRSSSRWRSRCWPRRCATRASTRDRRSSRSRVGRVDGTFVLEVRNDGLDDAPRAARGTGMGLRLAAAEALQLGGVIEFGSEGDSRWRVRLVVPVDDGGREPRAQRARARRRRPRRRALGLPAAA